MKNVLPFSPGADDNDELPDDLLALAEQLTADADRLATVFGPRSMLCSGNMEPEGSRVESSSFFNRRRSWLRIAGAAAIVFALGAGAWRVSREGIVVPGPRHEKAVAATGARTNEIEGQVSASSFQDLTSPEQEGLLDLLETSGARTSSLSI